jgi:hypothetical protein
MPESLFDTSLDVWKHILNERSVRDPIFGHIDIDKAEVQISTDGFIFLMLVYAESIGIDTVEFGKKLVESDKRDELLRIHTAIAFRTIFEVEGHYVEVPNACTLYKIPTKFLIVVGVAMIGIATGKASQIDPVLGGAVGGVGSLLINILAARYMNQYPEKQKITWTEELILRVLEIHGEKSLKDLRKQTRLYKQTIKETLESLDKKGFIEKRNITVNGKRPKTEIIFSAKKNEYEIQSNN